MSYGVESQGHDVIAHVRLDWWGKELLRRCLAAEGIEADRADALVGLFLRVLRRVRAARYRSRLACAAAASPNTPAGSEPPTCCATCPFAPTTTGR